MIKKILILLAVVFLIVVGVIYFVGSSALNKAVKTGVETFGPKVTQTPVTLGSVSLSVLSGNGTLEALNVGNPEGFKSENIFALGRIDIDVAPRSVFSDKVVINKIHIRAPEISYETTLRSSNVNELLKNIEEFTGPSEDKPDAPAEESGASKKVVIKELIIEDGKVYVGVLGTGMTASLPRIEMTDIGEEGSGTSMADVLDLVLTKVVAAIGPAVADASKLATDAGKAAIGAAQEQVQQQVIENAGEAATDAAGDAVNKATEGLKGLFNK